MNINSLSFGVWNINGLVTKAFNKTIDDVFLTAVGSHDMFFIVETHLNQEKSNSIAIQGYHGYFLNRPRNSKAKKDSGGVALFVKHNIRRGIKILNDHVNASYMWVQLKKDFFGFKNDIYLCCAYIPPHNSTYQCSNDCDILADIGTDIAQYSREGQVILCGDLNARTGQAPDYIVDDNDNHLLVDSNYVCDTVCEKRISQDHVYVGRGKQLLELCIQSQMRILNGRTFGDSLGRITCHRNRCSVVDYTIVSEQLMSDIVYFYVADLKRALSDHCRISFRVKARYTLNNNMKGVVNTYPLPRKYVWDDNSADKLQRALGCSAIQDEISKYMDTNFTDSDAAASAFNPILYGADSLSLKHKESRKTAHGKRKHKKWFD